MNNRQQAVRAARAVAAAVGIRVDRPRVLKDSNNTIVHLAPSPIVAKVGTSHFRPARLESLERDLAVAAYLSGRGIPVVEPTRDVPPGPYESGNLTVTLWQYIERREGKNPHPAEIAGTLRSVHDGLLGFADPLPSFRVELDDARTLLRPDRSPALSAGDRHYLTDVLEEVHVVLSTVATEIRPLHGSPHNGNWLMAASGPLLLDFETACTGPLEWDLAALHDETLDLFPEANHELIAVLRRMRSVCVAAKCWVDPTRAPEILEAAHVHLRLLRGEDLEAVR